MVIFFFFCEVVNKKINEQMRQKRGVSRASAAARSPARGRHADWAPGGWKPSSAPQSWANE
jgi:hypothetical protein